MNAPSRGMRQPPVRRRAALPATRQPVALSDTRTTIPCPALARRARSRVRGGRGVGNAAVRRAPVVRARRARWRTSRAAAGRGDRRDRAFRSTAFGPMSSGGRALAPGPQLGASALSRRSVDVSVAATSVRSCRSPPTRSTPPPAARSRRKASARLRRCGLHAPQRGGLFNIPRRGQTGGIRSLSLMVYVSRG